MHRPAALSATLAAACGLSLAALCGCNNQDEGDGSTTGSGTPVPSVTIASAAAPSATQASFTVLRPGPTDQALTVTLAASDAASAGDYAVPESVTIPAGSFSAPFTVARTADAVFEGTRTVTVSVAAGTGYAAGSPSSAQGAMADVDLPQVAGTYSGSFTPSSGVAAMPGAGGGGSLAVVGLAVVPSPALFLAAAAVNWTADLTQSGGTVGGRYVDDRGYTGSVSGTVDGSGALSLTVTLDGAPAGTTVSGTVAIAATVQPDAGVASGIVAAGSAGVTQGFTATTGGVPTAHSGGGASTMAGAGTADGTPARPSSANPIGFWNYDGNDLQVSPRQIAWLNGGYQRLDAWGQPTANSAVTVSGSLVTLWRDQGAAYAPASQRYLTDVWALAADGASMSAVSRQASADNATFADLAPLYAGVLLRANGDPWTPLSAAPGGIAVDGLGGDWPTTGPINADPAGDQGSGGNAATDIVNLWACADAANGALALFVSTAGDVADSPSGANRVIEVTEQNGAVFTLYAGLGAIQPGDAVPAAMSANLKDKAGTVVLGDVPAWSSGAGSMEAAVPLSALGLAGGAKVLLRVRTQNNSGATIYDRTRAIPVRLP